MGWEYIRKKGKILWHYEDYETLTEAKKEAWKYKKEEKGQFLILKREKGWIFPEIKYSLYTEGVATI